MKTLSAVLCSLFILAPAVGAQAAVDRSAVEARYRSDRQACLTEEAEEASARHACLREAGAARQEALRGELGGGSGPADWRRNALARCSVHHDALERSACERMALGGGESEGSVAEGAVIREITVPVESPTTR